MNKERRRELDKILQKLNIAHTSLEETRKCLKDIKNDLDIVYEDETESFDNMPEGLQSSWNGQMSDEAIGNLEEAIDNLEKIDDLLNDTLSYIEDAKGI